ncbi:MAG: aminomethyltransferase family protein [Candidatus Binatia bacterium]
MASTPLRAVEAENGAAFQIYGGLELPEKFTDAMAECEAVRSAAGLFDLSFRGRLRLTGPDRTPFLHNLLSNDVTSLASGQGRYATLLTDQSKIVTDLDVLVLEDAVLLDLDTRVLEAARAHLERYLIADEVEIEDRRDAETTLGVHGRRAEEVLAPLAGPDLPAAPLEHRVATIAGVETRVVRKSWTGEAGFDLIVARGDGPRLWKEIRDRGAPLGLVPAGMFAFNVLRVEAGVPWMGVDFDATNLVLEAALEGAISFTKGCYLGQETVERVSARGHVNRRRIGIRLDGNRVPRTGARVTAGDKELGRVTSAVWSPGLQAPIAFAILKREALTPGTAVAVEIAGGSSPATVVEPPFVRR